MNVNLDTYFDAQKPTVTVFGRAYEVDNDYKKVLAAQRKFTGIQPGADSGALMRELLTDALTGGRQAAEDILAHNMPFAFWNLLQFGVLAAMTGKSVEQLRETARQAQTGATFRPGNGTEKRL